MQSDNARCTHGDACGTPTRGLPERVHVRLVHILPHPSLDDFESLLTLGQTPHTVILRDTRHSQEEDV